MKRPLLGTICNLVVTACVAEPVVATNHDQEVALQAVRAAETSNVSVLERFTKQARIYENGQLTSGDVSSLLNPEPDCHLAKLFGGNRQPIYLIWDCGTVQGHHVTATVRYDRIVKLSYELGE